ncbi:DNA-binding domain-containing protein [uncultured Methylibium sp.]|uniref:HvfC/BufC N-terminal domain-containing protein n=1 Tax=uncultured Methylibium sp. TaxID=381093 RepID=UPI0025DEEE0C|nr:DNA-binding domain-containing protein [uncultured Methylibium sp.]
MTRLADQQRRLQRAIVGAAPAAAQADEADALLRTRDGGGPPLLGIYRHAYRARLAEALRDNHELLPRVMGDEAFDALAAAYVEAHPSRHPSIRWYGAGLADFMAARTDLSPHPALADLARLEWALRAAFDAPDAQPIEAAALAGRPADAWASLRFAPLPSAALLPLGWRIGPLVQALRADDSEAEPPEPEPAAHHLLIWRPRLDTRWRSLEPLEAALLEALFAGERFESLCLIAAARQGDEHAAAVVVGLLQGWIAEGLIASFDA